jgi:hypothetical protein
MVGPSGPTSRPATAGLGSKPGLVERGFESGGPNRLIWRRAAQAAIAEHGETVTDRYGQVKVNPACGLEKDARNGFLAALRALNLDILPLRDKPGRPTGS